MKPKCRFCNPDNQLVICSGTTSQVMIPYRPHISPRDGGHLIVVPKRHLKNRIPLKAVEVLEMDYLSIVASRLLQKSCNSEWFNFQENGNWTLDNPKLQHLHLHIYGRKTDAAEQPYGEALRFPRKKHLSTWEVEPFNEGQIELMREHATDILNESWVNDYKSAIRAILNTAV